MICGANVFDVPHIQRNVLLELPTAHLCDGYISIYKVCIIGVHGMVDKYFWRIG